MNQSVCEFDRGPLIRNPEPLIAQGRSIQDLLDEAPIAFDDVVGWTLFFEKHPHLVNTFKSGNLFEPQIVRDLDVAYADRLPATFTPPSELLQGLLTAGGGSMLYGASNSGKTFLVIDIACAVARGVPWMGRQSEPGLVVYLAAESPSSVRSRLQAYQRHHRVRVPNFAIVQNPIDLFSADADTDAVIDLVREMEISRVQKVRLIVGDTLARLSAGANENAGQDMGLVVRRFDRIRTVCDAHFMLVHHSGKAAAAGARGWSGIRAAMDTEIEVTESPAGRCAEITKQRDLNSKGDRIGFQLQVVNLGSTKWGTPATSCVVAPAAAPKRQTSKRISEAGGAVAEFLRSQTSPIKKLQVVNHFAGRFDKTTVYREIKKLVEANQLQDNAGLLSIQPGDSQEHQVNSENQEIQVQQVQTGADR